MTAAGAAGDDEREESATPKTTIITLVVPSRPFFSAAHTHTSFLQEGRERERERKATCFSSGFSDGCQAWRRARETTKEKGKEQCYNSRLLRQSF